VDYAIDDPAQTSTLVAGLCCTAVTAIALSAHMVWLIFAWLNFEPPSDMESPSIFVAMLMASIIAVWTGLEALTAWIVFIALFWFPRGRFDVTSRGRALNSHDRLRVIGSTTAAEAEATGRIYRLGRHGPSRCDSPVQQPTPRNAR
jgi:hypothetical protein